MKRYDNEDQIIRDIDHTKKKATTLILEAEQLEAHAKSLRILVPWDEQAKECIVMAKKKRKSSSSLIDKKLPKLGSALAQMRTTIFPFVPDASTVMK